MQVIEISKARCMWCGLLIGMGATIIIYQRVTPIKDGPTGSKDTRDYQFRYFLDGDRSVPLLSGECRAPSPPSINPYQLGRSSDRSLALSGEQQFLARRYCPILRFASPEEKLPIVALASAPGSGNTWLRHLVQQLTGIFTGSIYHDRDLKMMGFFGETTVNRTVIGSNTHEHWNCSLTRQNIQDSHPCAEYEKAILLVRDPHQTILAEFNRMYTNSHVQAVDSLLYKTEEWHETSLVLARRWIETLEVWSTFRHYRNPGSSCLLVVSFRRLQTSLEDELLRVGRFLGVREEYLGGEHLDCVLRNSQGSFKRKNEYKPSLAVFSERCNKTIEGYKQRANIILANLGETFTV